MSYDYICEGAPIFPACPNPALLLDKENNNLYISNGSSTNWILIAGGGGGVTDSVQNITTNETISFIGSINTFVKSVAGVGGITLTLPNAIGVSGQVITIIQTDTGLGGVLIQTNPLLEPAQTINGMSSYVLTNQYQAVSLESDNANWFVRSTAN